MITVKLDSAGALAEAICEALPGLAPTVAAHYARKWLDAGWAPDVARRWIGVAYVVDPDDAAVYAAAGLKPAVVLTWLTQGAVMPPGELVRLAHEYPDGPRSWHEARLSAKYN